MQESDHDLVRLASAGDDVAFHALVDRHAAGLFRTAMALSSNRADAEDVVQETLVAAHRGLKGFAGRSSVKTWLTSILTRKAYKLRHRSRHSRAAISLDAAAARGGSSGLAVDAGSVTGGLAVGRTSGAVDSVSAARGPAKVVEHRMDVAHVLSLLSEPHREVLVLREMQQLSYEEIAAVLKVPRGTVESRLFRARAEFRAKYGSIERGA